MQITKELLQKYADTTVEKLTRVDHTIIAVLLTGSMVTGETPFLGGTADIDLIFIHVGNPKIEREILRLNEDVHLDIAHHPQRDYLRRLELRVHPWKGPVLQEAVTLYDPQHFMNLTQASVRGLFYRADNVIQRSRAMLTTARDLGGELQLGPENPGPQQITDYLRVLNAAANAIALLAGEPLTERRFLLNFPRRAERIDRPGLAAGLLGMLGAPRVEKNDLASWLADWENSYHAVPEETRPPRLSPYRLNYYKKAFDVLLDSGQPENILWPLLRTWTLAVSFIPEADPAYQSWADACQQLGLLGPDFPERSLALNAFLEQIETTVAEWGNKEGVY